jgi:Flp pilus assembly protein TadG
MDSMKRFIRAGVRRDSGAELIEFAIVVPLLLFIIAGIIDFGILFQRYEVVTNAAREGARVGILSDYVEADVQQRVITYLQAGGLTDTAPTPAVEYSSAEVTPGGPTISVVRVTVQYPHQFLFLGPVAGFFGGGPHADIMLTSASTMRREVAAVP